nr:MAG TPA: hypothetical protein [Caudoviricetes sp.]
MLLALLNTFTLISFTSFLLVFIVLSPFLFLIN